MKFRLIDLEQYTGEQALLRGEAWYADGRVNHLRELERHLWAALIETENGPVEVEASITPTRLKAASCECADFREYGECGHITALLFALRARQRQEKEHKPAPRKPGKSRLTTDSILEQADPDEMAAFIRHYAKHNRPFALALKAWFVPQVFLPGQSAKYLEILESGIAGARTNTGRISVRGGKFLHRLLTDLLLQARRNLEMAHFSETAELSLAIIEKISPLLRKLEGADHQLLDSVKEALDLVQSLATFNIPFDLRQQLFVQCQDESRKLVYRNLQLDIRFYQIMAEMAQETEQRETLIQVLENQLEKYYYENRDPVPLLLLRLKLYGPMPAEEDLRTLAQSLAGFSKVLLSFCRKLKETRRLREARFLAGLALQQSRAPESRIELEDLLLEIESETGNDKVAAGYAKSLFQLTLDLRYFLRYAELGGKKLELMKWLYAGKNDPAMRKALAEVLKEEGRQAELLGLLQTYPNLEFLSLYSPALVPEFENELFALMEAVLIKHLQSHLGKVASQRVRETLVKLRQQGAGQLADRLAEAIRQAYPERPSLLEALRGF